MTGQTSESSSQTARQSKPKKEHFFDLMDYALFGGLFIAFLINFAKWQLAGFDAVMNQLDNAYTFEMDRTAQRGRMLTDDYNGIVHIIQEKMRALWQGTEKGVNEAAEIGNISGPSKEMKETGQKVGHDASHLWAVFFSTFAVLFAKFLSIAGSAMLYVFLSFLGVVDGLSSRYLRTKEAGRESTFMFHHVPEKMLQMPFWFLLAYLIIPMPLNPEIIVCLFAAVFFSYFYVKLSQLKKFL